MNAWSGFLKIDESQFPGGSLQNASFTYIRPETASDSMDDWLIDSGFNFGSSLFHATRDGTLDSFFIATDSNRNIVSWRVDFMLGPPDHISTTVRDFAYRIGPSKNGVKMDMYFTAPPGQWSIGEPPILPPDPRVPVPIPVPSALILMVTGFGALASRRQLLRRKPLAA